MSTPTRALTLRATSVQRDNVRLARVIHSKTPVSLAAWAHLWATTLPTPPAPMIRIFAMRTPLMYGWIKNGHALTADLF